jgi:hypothetical protein
MSDLDPAVAAEIKRHVRRARQILREDRILAGMNHPDDPGEDADGGDIPGDPDNDGKPKPPARKPPAVPESKAHPWWGKATP